MYRKNSKRCKVEGCCLPSKFFGEPESPLQTDKPDTNYPGLWQELYAALFCVPYTIAIFIYDIYSHSYLQRPKRPTWDMKTTFTVAIVHAMRNLFQASSNSLWRVVLYLPYTLSSTDRFYRASFTARKLNLPGILKTHDAIEDGTREIEAQWLLPLEEKEGKDERILLYVHGGGYCVKDWQAYINLTGSLSDYSKLPLFCVSYRLAPETRFPGAIVDVVQAYLHLIDQYEIDPKNIIVVGDSAGGGLVMALLIYLRDHSLPLPNSSILISPWIDLSYSHRSWLDASVHDVLPPKPDMEALMNPARFYLGPNQYQKLCKHPYASPLFANSFENLPPILLQYGSEETMSGEVRAFIKRLKTCKHTESRYEEYEDMIHDFQAFPIKKAHIAFTNVQHWIDSSLDSKNSSKRKQMNKKLFVY